MADTAPLELLTRGELTVRGRIVDASNATMLAVATLDGQAAHCVYKPVVGERPLWDFPSRTLARREVAAYVVSEAGGWGVVPPTVLRDGPFGVGSVQAWVHGGDIDADGDPGLGDPGAGLIDVVPVDRVPDGWLTVVRAEGADGRPVALVHADDPVLHGMAVFDAVVNNADRKGGHVLRDLADRVFGIDNGLTFNCDPKLRTVLWGWAGQRLPAAAIEVLSRLAADLEGDTRLRTSLRRLLSAEEVAATAARVRSLLAAGRLPRPGGDWPAIPWPAF